MDIKQIEKAARAYCAANGINPDEMIQPIEPAFSLPPIKQWKLVLPSEYKPFHNEDMQNEG